MKGGKLRGWIGIGFIGVFFCIGGVLIVADPAGPVGWCWMVTLVLVLALMFAASSRRAKIRAEGIVALADIVDATETGFQINNRPVLRLKLRIHAPGRAPFEVESRETVPLTALGRLAGGAQLTVYLDPKDHNRFDIDWSAKPQHQVGSVQPGDETARDPEHRMRQLAELKAAGLISDAEYAQQKARILGEL